MSNRVTVLLFHLYAAFTLTTGFLVMAIIPPIELFVFAGVWALVALGSACIVVVLGTTRTTEPAVEQSDSRRQSQETA